MRGRPGPDIRANGNISNVPHTQRFCSRTKADGQLTNLLDSTNPAVTAYGNLLSSDLDASSPRILDILSDDLSQLIEGDSKCRHLLRAWKNDNLLLIATRGIHLSNPGNTPQFRFHDKIVNKLELHQLLGSGYRLVRSLVSLGVIDDVIINLPKTRGDWGNLGGDTRRKALVGILQSLADQLTSPVDIRTILKDECELGEARL